MGSRDSPLTVGALLILAALAVATLPTPLATAAAVVVVLATVLIGRRPETQTRPSESPASSLLVDLASLIEPLNEGVVILGPEHTVLAANPAAARIVDRPIESMVNVSLIQAVRDHDLAEVARQMTGQRIQVHLSTAGREVLAAATPVSVGEVRTLLLIEDLTDLIRAQRARSELVANVSHELRTPLAAARALAETLYAGVDELDERERFLGRLVEELGRLGDIIQRLLWLARLESGVEPFTIVSLDSRSLLQEAASRIAPVAEHRGVRVEVAPASDAGPALADRDRVLEILSNLLDNAVRHSPGDETVHLSTAREDGFVRFEVSDCGPGILPHDRERVFERFYTADRSRESGGGSGLGLAIARHIVQRLGGRIWIADNSSPGATLCFTLPAAAANATEPGHEAPD